MNEEEKKLLFEIDNIHTELTEEPSGKWTGRYMQEPCGYNYCRNAERLKEKVFKLHTEFKPDYLSEITLEEIVHTFNKEVSFVDYHYKLAIKKNAAKKRNTEFLDSIYKANQQINLDLFSLFAKIKEVKKLDQYPPTERSEDAPLE